jgi:enterochelin esterase-like enzyme
VGSFGELTVVSVQFIGGLAVVALLGWWLLCRRRGRPSSPTRTASLAFAASLFTLLMVASCVNAYFSYLPKISDVVDVITSSPPPDATVALAASQSRGHPRGELVRLRVPDNGSGFGRSSALVWLPPQYFSSPRAHFSVVYLFHGSPGVDKDWFRGGEAGQIAAELAAQGKPAILVAPRMSRGWLDDSECVDSVKEKVETHLVRDVIPTVDAVLRTVPNRDDRIFGGMSAGGYCALNLGLRHRELVSTVLDLSGFTVPTHAGGLKALFGQAGSRQAQQNSPATYVSSLPAGPSMRIWMDSGTADHEVLNEMRTLAPELRDRGVTVVERTRSGGHTYSVWRPALRDSLGWALSVPPGARSVRVTRGVE